MYGDITRSTFDATRRRTSVRQQQGRGLLDAEWNEQRDIELHDTRTTRIDVIGAAAGPLGGNGMEITASGGGLGNQLYRVQIHDGNFDPTAAGGIGATTPTFTWGRDNASVVAAWTALSGLDVEVDRLGPGGAEGFPTGGWVELTTDARELDEL